MYSASINGTNSGSEYLWNPPTMFTLAVPAAMDGSKLSIFVIFKGERCGKIE